MTSGAEHTASQWHRTTAKLPKDAWTELSSLHASDMDDSDAEMSPTPSAVTTADAAVASADPAVSAKSRRAAAAAGSRRRRGCGGALAAMARGLNDAELQELRLKINSRERQRMHDLNSAMDGLRSVMPTPNGPSARKLSKITTLLLAKNYILVLSRALQDTQRMVLDRFPQATLPAVGSPDPAVSCYQPFQSPQQPQLLEQTVSPDVAHQLLKGGGQEIPQQLMFQPQQQLAAPASWEPALVAFQSRQNPQHHLQHPHQHSLLRQHHQPELKGEMQLQELQMQQPRLKHSISSLIY